MISGVEFTVEVNSFGENAGASDRNVHTAPNEIAWYRVRTL